MRYKPAEIEPKWQQNWARKKSFEVSQDISQLKNKPKYYVLDMFPYPSSAGLHVGHPEGYSASDVVARIKRLQGYNVLHPMGWDAFGLPAERAAVGGNIHPAIITKKNVNNFRRQIKRLGFSYDWSREISTTDVDYYKWTQWIFLKLHEKGLAYLANVPVNWCPALGTVLANEEVKDGVYVETGDKVEKRLMRQWMLKITAYAERLIEDLDDLDWPKGIKEMQRNWIGKSMGADICFAVNGLNEKFTVFTTRPDTLFGATYCVLAPEHELVNKITTSEQKPVVALYVEEAKSKPDLERQEDSKTKSGVFTGAFAVHPITAAKLPIWVADYVLANYGTGAVMAVPAHDDRDYAFAKKFNLPIIEVIDSGACSVQGEANAGAGKLINSYFLNGLKIDEAIAKMISRLEQADQGKGKVQYRLRDWLFSRQRYWGEPFPIVHLEDGSIEALSEDELPVELPIVDEYKPTAGGQPPLARADKNWLNITLKDGRKGQREVNTMPQWAGSCWYYLRYLDPNDTNQAFSKDAENYWMPVDLYIGGVEHAVLHLLYARFWHKVLYDCGLVHTKEPFKKLFNQGMILAHSYQDEKGKYYHPDDIEEKNGKFFVCESGLAVVTKIEKMSKSKLNVVNPDDIIDKYGADAMRLYELFMGPLEQVKPWQIKGMDGVYRFLQRSWRLVVDSESGKLSKKLSDVPGVNNLELWCLLNQTIKKVEEDTEHLRFNTAISQMMSFVNEATAQKEISKQILGMFLKLLCPYAPHIAEELWQRLGHKTMLSLEVWPKYDEEYCVSDTITLAIQVNGKRRDQIEVAKNTDKSKIENFALQREHVKKFIEGKSIKRVIVVPGRLVNIVAV